MFPKTLKQYTYTHRLLGLLIPISLMVINSYANIPLLMSIAKASFVAGAFTLIIKWYFQLKDDKNLSHLADGYGDITTYSVTYRTFMFDDEGLDSYVAAAQKNSLKLVINKEKCTAKIETPKPKPW